MQLLLGKEVRSLGERWKNALGPHAPMRLGSQGESKGGFCLGGGRGLDEPLLQTPRKEPLEGENRPSENHRAELKGSRLISGVENPSLSVSFYRQLWS